MKTRIAALLALSGLLSAPAFARQHHEPAQPEAKAKVTAPAKIEPKPAAKPTEPAAEGKTTTEPKAFSKPTEPKAEATAEAKPETLTPDQALARLQEGNQRWTSGKATNPRIGAARLKSQADGGQTPFAAILTCADSRIPVERVFDQGVGDIFDVRVAGNIAGDHETGSLEYGAEHLKTPVLVVMGHTKCGAVGAAATNAKVAGHIPSLISVIEPSVARAQALNPTLKGADLVPAAIKENVWQSVFTILKTSPICRERIAHGELKIVGAVYNIADGSIEWMGEHPWQSELLTAFARPGEKATEQASETGSDH